MTDKEVLEKCLWIARDLSIKLNGQVPSVVTDSPAALNRIEAELTRLREERDSLDVQVRAALRYTDALRAERDEARDYGERLYAHVQRLEAWRQHLEAALQDIGNDADAYHPLAVKARDGLSTPKEPTDD